MVEEARPLRAKSVRPAPAYIHPIVSFLKAKVPSMSLRGLGGCFACDSPDRWIRDRVLEGNWVALPLHAARGIKDQCGPPHASFRAS